MKNKVTLVLMLLLSVVMLSVSCDFLSASSTAASSGLSGDVKSTIDGWITDEEAVKTVTPGDGGKPEAYEESDYDMGEGYTSVEINLSNITLTETETKTKYDNHSITTGSNLITIESDDSSSLNFILTGTSKAGLKIKSKKNFVLTLNGVTITSAEGSGKQALNCTKSSTCFLVLSGTNTLTGDTQMKKDDDGSEDGVNVIKCDGSLVISGDGTLDVKAETKHGIVSDDTVVVNGGTINVTLNSSSSDGTGIKAANGFVQNGGEITIAGENKTEGSENKGIKVEGDESESGAGKGYVLINGGKLTITTSGKAITASFDITEDGDTGSTENDPLADVFINNGLITITTTATPREDVTDSSGNVTTEGVSPEGIEGKRSVTINGGKIVINSTDDGINASLKDDGYIKINGGLIYVNSSKNDAVDSNGTIEITGGILLAVGASAPEGGIDCDENSRFTYSGGTVVALGGSNNTPQSSTTTGCYLYCGGSGMMRGGQMGPGGPGGPGGNGGGNSSLSSGDIITLLDSSGNVILSFKVPDGADTSNLLIASSSIKKGSTYSISSSSTVDSASYTFADSLYLGDVEVSVDESESVTISSLGTSISL